MGTFNRQTLTVKIMQNDKRVDELEAQLYAAESERDALLYGRGEPPTAAEVIWHEAEDGISEWLHRCGSHGDIVHVEVVDGEVIDVDRGAPPCNRGRWWALRNGVCMGIRPTSAPSEWIASLRERAEKAESERDAALAIVAGGVVAPTDAELEAHREAGGAWVLVFSDDSFSLIRSSLGLIRHYRDAGLVKTWFSIDVNGRSCLRTPVATEAK